MIAAQRVIRERRQYNKWVASQTLEDYALRFTPEKARRWPAFGVAGTAIGATSFLACEAIGASITLAYGFANSVAAIGAAVVLMFLIGLPIVYHSARHGLDVDLLTRGAGFGYLGSTITSLIYASFTFLLFAIEASIMSTALETIFAIPLRLAHVLSVFAAVPVALYGMTAITRMQRATQPVWLLLQFAPVGFILYAGHAELADWSRFAGRAGGGDGAVDLLLFGLAFSTLLSLLPQISEQADYLRFLPAQARAGRARWWLALLAGGPGWALIGGVKLLIGSFLAVYVLHRGLGADRAGNPTEMFRAVFGEMVASPSVALALTGILVIVCQLKINVTNAYAGSIAWSNFFSRLTHAHPGRVVWLLFNVLLALLLMEIGFLRAMEAVLILYANLAAGWIGALSASLVVSQPLGLSPPGVEFKRAHLYDINPVGVGAMALSILVSTLSLVGLFGPLAHAFSPAIGLAVAFAAAPAIALATRGRFFLARDPIDLPARADDHVCTICENGFERPDMAWCPAYGAPICSLCCTLETRCHDMCKTDSRIGEQLTRLLDGVLPARVARSFRSTTGQFAMVMAVFAAMSGLVLYFVYLEYRPAEPLIRPVIATTLWIVFFAFTIVSGVAAWLIVLAHASRRAAETENARHIAMLSDEIAAHERTDAELQRARDVAEAANAAKSRYIVGVSHEIRSPLNAIYGYAQLLERDGSIAPEEAGRVIRRSSEHLTNLVDGLLDISRIESGVLRLSRDTVRLPALLDQLTDMFRLQAAAKGIAFRDERPSRLPEFVRTDQKRLRQILINLLSNAVKYTREGHAGLIVRYRSQIAEFEVFDSGFGIKPDELETIFEPFERGSTADARSQHGTGLGLSITKVLVQIMGGEIRVESEVGKGSRFLVRLMLADVQRPPAEEIQPRRVTGYEGRRRTILLVDDDPAQILVLTRLLEPLGFIVRSALDGRSGIAMAGECDPDLAILDLAMPGLSGWEVAAALRRARAGLRILIISANAHEYSRGGDGHAAHDMFLMKPLELDALLDALAELLALQWTGTAAADAGAAAPGHDHAPGEAASFLGELERLGRIGHVRGIEAAIAEMCDAAPATDRFAARLRARVRAFDLKGFLAIVRSARQDG